MKKSIISTLVGFAAVATTYGQGHILFSNYFTSPFNQIYFNSDLGSAPDGLAGQAVANSWNAQFQVFYGEGVISDASLLTPGVTFGLSSNPDYTGYDPGMGHGAGGYFELIEQLLPTWAAGDTFTFQIRLAEGPAGWTGESALWQESANIRPELVGGIASQTLPSVIVTVPEPSTLALAGLGSAALLIFRRRK